MSDMLGQRVENWVAPPRPDGLMLQGQFAALEPLNTQRHSADLFRANSESDDIWAYLPYGPFSSHDAYAQWVEVQSHLDDPVFMAVQDVASKTFLGVASYLRIAPEAGSIEVGHINFSPALQGTRAATEAMYLMMQWAFEAGYRRYEWKCNALNLGSRRAAARFGFSYEGIFRQAAVVKGYNRDTAWYAIIDSEWPALKATFESWLDRSNFDADGQQTQRLSDLTRPLLYATDPAL